MNFVRQLQETRVLRNVTSPKLIMIHCVAAILTAGAVCGAWASPPLPPLKHNDRCDSGVRQDPLAEFRRLQMANAIYSVDGSPENPVAIHEDLDSKTAIHDGAMRIDSGKIIIEDMTAFVSTWIVSTQYMTGASRRTGLYQNNKLQEVETIHIEYLDRAYSGIEETADYWIIGGHAYMEGLPNCDVRMLGRNNESTSGQIKQIVNGESYGVSLTQTLLAKPVGIIYPESMLLSEGKLKASGQHAFQPEDLTPAQRGDVAVPADERRLFVVHSGVATSITDDAIAIHVDDTDQHFRIGADTELIAGGDEEGEASWWDSVVSWVRTPPATALFTEGNHLRIVTELGSDAALSVEIGHIEYAIRVVGPAL